MTEMMDRPSYHSCLMVDEKFQAVSSKQETSLSFILS